MVENAEEGAGRWCESERNSVSSLGPPVLERDVPDHLGVQQEGLLRDVRNPRRGVLAATGDNVEVSEDSGEQRRLSRALFSSFSSKIRETQSQNKKANTRNQRPEKKKLPYWSPYAAPEQNMFRPLFARDLSQYESKNRKTHLRAQNIELLEM